MTPGEKVLRGVEKELREKIIEEVANSVEIPTIGAPPAEQQESSYFTVQQFADRLGFTALTIYNWIKKGTLQCVQPTGKWGKIRIPSSELKRLAGYAKREVADET